MTWCRTEIPTYHLPDGFLRILKWKSIRLNPVVIATRGRRSGLALLFFVYNFQYKIGGKLSLIRCHIWFSVRQRTGSNPADIDMLRSHNGKFFTFLINLNNFLSALIKLFFYHGYLKTLNNNLRKKQNISLSFLCLYIYLYFL